MKLEKELQEGINKKNIFKDEPMKNHTSFKVGGIADYFVKIETIDELKFLIKYNRMDSAPWDFIMSKKAPDKWQRVLASKMTAVLLTFTVAGSAIYTAVAAKDDGE